MILFVKCKDLFFLQKHKSPSRTSLVLKSRKWLQELLQEDNNRKSWRKEFGAHLKEMQQESISKTCSNHFYNVVDS